MIWEIKFSQESELIKLQKKYPNNNNLVEEIFQSHLANKVNIKSELFEKLNKVGIYNIEKWEISIRGYNLKKWQEVEVRLKESDRSERGYAKAIHRNKREDFHTAFLKIRQEEYEKKKKQWESIRHMNSEELNTFIISQAQSLNLFFRKENLLSVPIEKKRSFAHKLLYWNISWKVIEYKPTKPWYNDEDNIIINILGTTQKFKIDDIQNKDYIDIKWEVIDYNWKENSIKIKWEDWNIYTEIWLIGEKLVFNTSTEDKANEKLKDLWVYWWIEEIITKHSSTKYKNLHPDIIESISETILKADFNTKKSLLESLNNSFYDIKEWQITEVNYSQGSHRSSYRTERYHRRTPNSTMANEYKKIILKNLSNMTGEEIDNFNIWFVTREKQEYIKQLPKEEKINLAKRFISWRIKWKITNTKNKNHGTAEVEIKWEDGNTYYQVPWVIEKKKIRKWQEVEISRTHWIERRRYWYYKDPTTRMGRAYRKIIAEKLPNMTEEEIDNFNTLSVGNKALELTKTEKINLAKRLISWKVKWEIISTNNKGNWTVEIIIRWEDGNTYYEAPSVLSEYIKFTDQGK